MAFKSWSEMTGENPSPYSPTGQAGFNRSPESSALLEKASEPSQKLDQAAANLARKKYRKESNQEIGRLNSALASSNVGFGKPGEARTDEEENEDQSLDETHEGIQIVRPADEKQVLKQQAQKESGSYDEPIYPEWTKGENDHFVGDSATLRESDLPENNNVNSFILPKESRTTIDNGPSKYVYGYKPDNITLSRADILEEASKQKLWQGPMEPELMNEPGYPEEIKKAEEKKKGWWPW